MPSQAMQDVIEALRDRRKASASQAPPTLEQRRAAFTPGDRLHPVPDDVRVTEVTAGGVPAHWLTPPGTGTGRVLLLLPTSTGSCSAPPRQPRPPGKSGRSCAPRSANQTAHRHQASPRPARPLAAQPPGAC